MRQPHPNTLLVEGKDDFNVIRNLWVNRFPSDRSGDIVLCPNGKDEFKIRQAGEESETGGDSKLLRSFSAHIRQWPPDLERLGIVMDADEQVDRRWKQVTDRLYSEGYEPPPNPPAGGLVLEHPAPTRPRIGVWLMPDNHIPGKLEDFVRLLIPKDNALGLKADDVLNDIEREKLQLYASKDRPKAFIHTWLAWQKKPGRPMGQAFTNRALQPDSPAADPFIAWLQRLFCAAP